MTGRRLTDRIRELCAKALDREEPDWDSTLRELQFAIQEHTLRLANTSVAASVAGQVPVERRKAPGADPVPHGIRTLFELHMGLHPHRKAGAHSRKSRIGVESSSRTSSQKR